MLIYGPQKVSMNLHRRFENKSRFLLKKDVFPQGECVYGQFMNTCEKKVAFNFGEQGVYKNMHTRRCDNTKKSANSDLTKPDVLTQVDRAAFPSGRQA